jgi:dTDP-4-amino-4,6-dideoxygalactose transaminase
MGWRIQPHPRVERALCDRYAATSALLTDSGTSALILALRKLLPPGGTVALPGYACIDLTAAALGAGARVRLYDLDPATLSPDLDSLTRVVARGVDVVVVAHLYGYPADVLAVQQIAAPLGIPVIEDAAQGAGGSLSGRRLGSFGDIAILSFGRGKGMTAGSGGALLARSPELGRWADAMRRELGTPPSGGREVMTLAAQTVLGHPSVYRLPASIPGLKLGEMVYRPPTEARPMASTAAAVLQAVLKVDDGVVEGRRARAKVLASFAANSSSVAAVHSIVGGEPGFLRFAISDRHGSRSPHPAIGALRGYPMTLDQHAPLQPLLLPGEQPGSGAEFLRTRLFTVPTHSRVTQADLERLAGWLA